MATQGFGWFIQQPASLVVADRLDVHPGGVCQLANGQLCGHHFLLDSVLWYGV